MENYSTQITNYLLTQSWQIAVLVVVIAAATWLLKNKSAHIRYLLWLIVLAKCLVPPLLTVPVAILPQERPILLLETPPPMISEPVVSPPASDASPPAPARHRRLEPRTTFTARQWLALAWVAGVAVFFLFAVIKALRTDFWLWRQRKLLPAEAQTGIENLFSGLGIKTLPKVWLIDGIGQPFVWGLLRGSIYLPADFVKVNSAEHRRGILGHEVSHILRFDAAVNLLQIIAQAVFWFHPFVWWANKKIRAEREKCCDEMAIARLGAKAKEYSSAIVNILVSEYESTRPVPSLAVAGPVKNIEERIKTMLRPGKKFYKRPNWSAIIVSLLIAVLVVPTTLALTKRTKDKKNVKTDSTKISVAGQVVSEKTGKALIGALVRVAVPATDMRKVRVSTDHTIYEAQTDGKGRFSIEVPLDKETTDISVDAFLPGFRSAAGTFRSGGDFTLSKIPVEGNKELNLSIRLPSALYISGAVKDHQGQPLAGATVHASMSSDKSSGSIAIAETDRNGRFEIFDFPLQKRSDERGNLFFNAPTAKSVTIENIYEMDSDQQRSLEVVMPRGWVITGMLLDADGKPVANTNVEATLGPGIIIRDCVTDENGRFKLAGLNEGPIVLVAHAMDINQKGEMQLFYNGKDRKVIWQLKSVKPKVPIKRVALLGMQVADVNPEIQEIYDLHRPYGVVILDPGKDHQRLGIGELHEGYCFWMVGNKVIHNIQEMIAEICRIHAKPKPTESEMISEGHKGFIRVVYSIRGGTNTQYLRLDDIDANELRELIKLKMQILTDSQFILIPVDSNEIEDFLEKEEVEFQHKESDPNFWSCILNPEQVKQVIEFVRVNPDSSMLASPRVLCNDGEWAEIKIVSEERFFISDYSEPNSSLDEPQPKHDFVEEGISLQVKPNLQDDLEKNVITTDYNVEITKVIGYEKRMYKGKYPYVLPTIRHIAFSGRYSAYSGDTLVLDGHKIVDENGTKKLLVLIKSKKIDG